MILEILFIVAIIVFTILIIASIFIYKKLKNNLDNNREDENKSKMYEIEILNKLSDKIDYSLNIQDTVETITSSLTEFIDYSTVSYMLLFPEKIIFKTNIKKPISRRFVDDVKRKMSDSISLILNENFDNTKVEEILVGLDINQDSNELIGSFFNIPLVISDKVIGLLTIADTRQSFYREEEMTTLYKIAQQSTQAITRLQGVVESEKSKLNAMVASMTDGVIMTDKDYRVLVVNPAARKAIGLENENDLTVSDIANNLKEKFDLRDKIEESVRLDKVFLSDEISLPSGFFKVVVSPVKDSRRTLGCVVVFRDMTREKEVERIKEDFTSMIVHELRSPLDSIKKMSEMMRASEVKKAKREECFQMIYSSSSDMLELINNLLDIAKIEAGKFELLKQKSDIKKTIESRILFFDIAAKDAKVKISSCFSKDIPNDVEFDPHTISQVLNNLISNAIKFTKEGGNITVQALFHKKGESLEKESKDSGINWFVKKDMTSIPDSLLVAVTDSGIGIPKDQIDKLFNKFIQAKSTFVEKGGTGLGLAITKSIIDSHNGLVGVDSVEGQGTTFYFTLPV